MLDISITNGRGRRNKASVSENGFLRVENRPYYIWENYVQYFSNSTYGNNLAINATSNGTPENIHNGLDDIYWTGTNIVGNKAEFNSTDEAHTGTQSIKWDGDNNNNIFQVTNPAGVFSLVGFTSLDGWIYISDLDNPNNSILSIQGRNTVFGQSVGDSVDILNYVNKTTLKSWQSFSIPLIDLSLAGEEIDAFRFTVTEVGKIKFYLDDMILAAPGTASGVQEYKVGSVAGKVIEIESITFNIVASVDSTLADSSVPNIDYSTLLGTGLNNGILYRRMQFEEVKSSWVIRNFFDLIERPISSVEFVYGNATTKSIKVNWDFTENHVLRFAREDNLSLTISDNLAGLLKFTALSTGRIRDEDLDDTRDRINDSSQ